MRLHVLLLLLLLVVVVVVVVGVKGKVHPCTGRTAHRGRRGIALLFHDHDTRRG